MIDIICLLAGLFCLTFMPGHDAMATFLIPLPMLFITPADIGALSTSAGQSRRQRIFDGSRCFALPSYGRFFLFYICLSRFLFVFDTLFDFLVLVSQAGAFYNWRYANWLFEGVLESYFVA